MGPYKEGGAKAVGRRVLADSPPRLTKARPADSLRSGLVSLRESLCVTVDRAISEAVRILGGKPGDYHTVEASRRFPYGKGCVNLGGIMSKIVPRIYFSKPIPRRDEHNLPYNHEQKFDYEARFPLGTGPIATDEDNRIIHTWSPQMELMADGVWNAMKADERYRRLCRAGNKFNHVSVHAYRKGADIRRHKDRLENGNNSMKEGTPVAVLTVGSPRELSFYREYEVDHKTVVEDTPCYTFEQAEGSLFVLDPSDEVPKCRRNRVGKRRQNAVFSHSVRSGRDKNYFSVAFIFRCLESVAVVDSTTDKVVARAPKTKTEFKRRQAREAIRVCDEKRGSEFKCKVESVQNEWVRLMKAQGWMKVD